MQTMLDWLAFGLVVFSSLFVLTCAMSAVVAFVFAFISAFSDAYQRAKGK